MILIIIITPTQNLQIPSSLITTVPAYRGNSLHAI